MLAFVLSALFTVPAVELGTPLSRLAYSSLLLLASIPASGDVRLALLTAGSLAFFLAFLSRDTSDGVFKAGPLTVLRVKGREYVIGFNALGLLAFLPLFLL